MQAIGVRTGQLGFNRRFVGALLAVVGAAALVLLLTVGTISWTPAGPAVAPAAGLDADAQQKALIQFRADERAVLTPAQEAANLRDAVRKLHMKDPTEKSSPALEPWHRAAPGGMHGK
jgi:hypothetical protein